MNISRVSLAAVVAFVLAALCVKNLPDVFGPLSSWVVISALVATVIAMVIATAMRLRDSLIVLLAAVIVGYAVRSYIPALTAVVALVGIAALAASGAHLVFQRAVRRH